MEEWGRERKEGPSWTSFRMGVIATYFPFPWALRPLMLAQRKADVFMSFSTIKGR
jgi:hypothetical protein